MPRLNEDCTPDEVQRFNETIEEWMDELDDLVWRERGRLAADAGNRP